MKKNLILKVVFLLVALGLLAIVFVGCGSVICTTGTIYLYIDDDYGVYDVWINDYYWGRTADYGNYGYATIYNVPVGYCEIYVEAADDWCWGTKYGYIYCGTNPVEFYWSDLDCVW